MKAHRFKTAAAVSHEFNAIMKKILSRQTVSRLLAEHDSHARPPAVKPLVSSKNKKIVLFLQLLIYMVRGEMANGAFQ